MSAIKAELLLDLKAGLGEGAIWNPLTRSLCFVDILGRRVCDYDPASGRRREFATPELVGTVVPRQSGGVVLALAGGVAALDPEWTRLTALAVPAEHDPARCRFNDGKCDPQGRLWAGTMSLRNEREIGSLYCFAAGFPPRQVLTGIGVSNGLAWSLDGTRFYYIDTLTGRVDAFDFDPESGSLRGRRPAFSLPAGQGLPDGSTLDSEGMLWVAHWDGGRVSRWDPETGRCLATVTVPVPLVTSCAFGGNDLATLYITTARSDLTPARLAEAPASGGLFVCQPGVTGIPACSFAG